MIIPITIDGDRAVISPSGAIDQDTRPGLYAAADSLPASVSSVTWDLREVVFMDSAGLHLLEDQHRTARRSGGSLTVTGPQPQPLHLLRLAARMYPAGPWSPLLSGLPSAGAA
ncbi:STAS domain-containing protein [Streptomyces sp. NPDC048171]|uniref:STAS domain-containing protein n=1 Tax=Streptomyces sp. NPDC048171 TaxID=3365504 RepID=UPI0037248440